MPPKMPLLSSPTTFTVSYPDVKQPDAAVRPVQFQKPAQVMTYSHDATHVQRFDNSAMRYYVDPPTGARLDTGYSRWVRKLDARGRLDNLFRAFREMKAEGSAVPENGIVSWRGIMTKILTAPYEDRYGWELNIMFVNGVLYLEEHLTEAKLEEKCVLFDFPLSKAHNNMTPRHRQVTYYGYAFESFCTSDSPQRRPPKWGGDVNTNEQWCSLVKTKLGDTQVLIGGEVDCVRGQYTGNTDTFVELKTSMIIRGPQDGEQFEKKLLKFYFQSFLLGVPEIVVGFRTFNGVIQTVQTFKTADIPNLVRGKPGAWNPSICLEFGDNFFKRIQEAVTAGDQSRSSVWRASFTPGTGVSVRLLEQVDVDEVVNGEDRVGFLPRWHWDELVAAGPDVQRPDPQLPEAGPA